MKDYLKNNREGLIPLLVFILVTTAFFILKCVLKQDAEYTKNLLLAGGFGITILSWFVVGYINNENEKKRNQLSINQSILESKRDLRVRFLLDAYFRLENAGHRDVDRPGIQPLKYDYIYQRYAESALTSIQLLANDNTVKLANAYTLSGGKDHYDKLLIMLRNELREELELEPLPKTKDYHPTTFRAYRKLDAPNELTPEQQFELIIKLSEFSRQLTGK